MRDYETVFILTPVLSNEQMEDTVKKFQKVILDGGAEIVHEDHWGLRKLAYPINKKNTGFYTVIEFRAEPELIQNLEVEYRRDERVMRHLVISLDKHAVAYNQRKRDKLSEQAKQENLEEQEQS